MNDVHIDEKKIKKTMISFIEFLLVITFVTALEFVYFGFIIWDFHIPITYEGGDAFSSIASMKMRMLHDGYRLGWPLYEDVTEYSPIFNGIYRVASSIIVLFFDDFFLAQNIFLFLIPLVNVIVCYYIFCELKIKKIFSFMGALLFGFCPYVQIRLFLHQDLAAIECIPIVFLICFWLLEDRDFAIPGKGYFKKKRNLLLIFFGWLIANNGIVYYPFFSCFIFMVTGIVICIEKKSLKSFLPSITVIFNIVFWLTLGFVPAILGVLAGRGDVATNGTTRNAYRALVYGLDIRSMLLSPKGFGIDSITDFYNYLFEYEFEQYYAYIGIIGIIGFVILILRLLRSNSIKTTQNHNRITLLSKISIMLILLGTSCGLGVIVALFIPFIASYNRVSIFILFACICTVILMMDEWVNKEGKYKRLRIVGCIFLLAYALWEQQGCYGLLSKELLYKNTILLEQDKAFFADLEKESGDNAIVYMLPYMRSFEFGGAGNLSDYDHLRGYLNTDTVRWSYGAINSSDNDVWCEYVSELEAKELITELKKQNIAGIYINVDGYKDDAGKIITNEILQELGTNKYIMHESGLKVYIPIND